jgi:potassium-dependent mechanosensitive channel
VASDLRFIIEKRLAEDGIAIASPKRDVRVDAARPIKVEVVAGASAAASRDVDGPGKP